MISDIDIDILKGLELIKRGGGLGKQKGRGSIP